MLSMMPSNTINSIESNIVRSVTTTTTAHMVARPRSGIVIFPPLDAKFVEPTDTDVWTAL